MDHEFTIDLLHRRLAYEMSLEAALETSNAIARALHLSEISGLPVEETDGFFANTLAAARVVIRNIKATYEDYWKQPPTPRPEAFDSLGKLDLCLDAQEQDVADWIGGGIEMSFKLISPGDWLEWHSSVDVAVLFAEQLDPHLSEVFTYPALHIRIPSGRVRVIVNGFEIPPGPLVDFQQWSDETLFHHVVEHAGLARRESLLKFLILRAPELLYLARHVRGIQLRQDHRILMLSLSRRAYSLVPQE